MAGKLAELLPEHDYVAIADRQHAPYGERSYADIERLTHAAIQPLLACDIVVLACNTATAAAIDSLRTTYPDTTFVGFEPMIKPAAARSTTRHITLLATHATSHAPRTRDLINRYGADLLIDTPNTTGWATAIDRDHIEAVEFDEVARSVADGSDTIIIGCTHYIALIPRLAAQFPEVMILEPTDAIAQRISQLAHEPPR